MVLTVWRVKGSKNQKPVTASVTSSYKEKNTEIPADVVNKSSVFKNFLNWLLE